MIELFEGISVSDVKKKINEYCLKNPELRITAVSHANVVKTGFGAWNLWNAFVVFEKKGTV